NHSETDKDCGGDQGCARCTTGQLCSATSDCDGGACARGQCQAPTCNDALQNGAETDIDCGGGTCQPCEVGGVCLQTDDCNNLLCSKGKCQPAACDDKLPNQDETDVDCGGSCDPCADTLKCKAAGDCASGVCTKALVCAAPTCTDKVKNGNEPSVDCGGSCGTKCGLLSGCNDTSDCAALSCVDNQCLPGSANGKPLSPVSWTATASDKSSNSDASKAIDGVTNTFWTSGTAQVPKMWFALDLGSQQAFFSIEIDCFQQALDFPSAVDVFLSNDPTFPEAAVLPNYTGSAQMKITFQKAQAARYIKISLAQGGDHWWSIDEIRVKQ
ncbi:MAG TPA: discoidin domain-containing protein, partial [Polyangiaceae bacterium]|nr:discoidin domain-containing protein [Polyangiaceae bacterium]